MAALHWFPSQISIITTTLHNKPPQNQWLKIIRIYLMFECAGQKLFLRLGVHFLFRAWLPPTYVSRPVRCQAGWLDDVALCVSSSSGSEHVIWQWHSFNRSKSLYSQETDFYNTGQSKSRIWIQIIQIQKVKKRDCFSLVRWPAKSHGKWYS